jgi:hypothetical protein
MNLFFKNKGQYKIIFLQIKKELINIFLWISQLKNHDRMKNSILLININESMSTILFSVSSFNIKLIEK